MHQTVSKVAAPRLKRIISKVEVERKFNLGPDFASFFLSKGLVKPEALRFRVHNTRTGSSFIAVRQPGQIIRDTYYDTQNDQLSNLGLWVRQRHVQLFPLDCSAQTSHQGREVVGEAISVPTTSNSQKSRWNAKLRLGGHFKNSQFLELDGKKKVSDEVLRITGSTTKLEDLQIVTDLRTERSSWEVAEFDDGERPSTKMTIVLDDVTEAQAREDGSDKSAFAHTIGEVELFEEFVTEGMDSTEHEALRKKIAAQRMEELKGFMVENPDLFATTPTPIGKLSAYYTWKAARS
ncbi:hypothetical protein F5Y09DRAFT_152021 [Xylaria sp. FL1042]|nr:hypothetical protein F5Y09DRAFT_152021 [Xylaria sp. FL1042]